MSFPGTCKSCKYHGSDMVTIGHLIRTNQLLFNSAFARYQESPRRDSRDRGDCNDNLSAENMSKQHVPPVFCLIVFWYICEIAGKGRDFDTWQQELYLKPSGRLTFYSLDTLPLWSLIVVWEYWWFLYSGLKFPFHWCWSLTFVGNSQQRTGFNHQIFDQTRGQRWKSRQAKFGMRPKKIMCKCPVTSLRV